MMRRLLKAFLVAAFMAAPLIASGQQVGGAGNDNGWQLPAGTNVITVGDGSESQYTTIAAALTDIAADKYGWGVPTGGAGSIVYVVDNRAITTEQVTLPAGVVMFSAKSTILLADVSGGTPGVTLGPGSGIIGYFWGVSGGPGAPYAKVDLLGASGSELPTIISNNWSGGVFSSVTDTILIVGGHADSEVYIDRIISKTPGTNADIELANTFIGTVRINASDFRGDLIGNAIQVGTTGNGVGIYNSNFDDITLNGKIDKLATFEGGTASTFTFGAVANVARTFGMTVGTLTDNSTAGTLTDHRNGAPGTAYRKIPIATSEWNLTVGTPPAVGVASTTNAPALLYDDTTKETARFSIVLPGDVDLSVNPEIRLILAPVSAQTTGSTVVFEAVNRYVGDSEVFNKAIDETVTANIAVSNTALERITATLTLDKTKLAAEDHIGIALSRLPADASDDRNGDAAVASTWLVYKKLTSFEVY